MSHLILKVSLRTILQTDYSIIVIHLFRVPQNVQILGL